MPRENPSLPRTQTPPFSLKDSSIYTIYPIIPSIELPIYILTLYNDPTDNPADDPTDGPTDDLTLALLLLLTAPV